MQALKAMEQTVQDAPDQQVSLTDPDARSMATSGKGTATVGYNVQIAVDAEHHLIVAHEVINQGYDRHQLAPMAFKAQEATGCEQVTALADRGYFNGDQVLSCEGTGVAPIVPKTLTSSGTKRGFFTRQDFIYDAEHDHYTCPAGAKLTKAKRRADHTEDFDFYRHLSACFTCPLKSRCTPTKLRRIKRWENEDVLDRMQDRLDRMPEAMGVRRQTVEHPFGTLKAWMGATHFLTRTLDKVRTEMSLHVLAYNLKRMITIFGVGTADGGDQGLIARAAIDLTGIQTVLPGNTARQPPHLTRFPTVSVVSGPPVWCRVEAICPAIFRGQKRRGFERQTACSGSRFEAGRSMPQTAARVTVAGDAR